ncbi:ATP synthase complex subunit H-domain-containing protein [Lyophyllum atratum]|nr:ATP synthase complex subunit H-domain-containing protein [Lyophyllum atratum]
MSAFLRQASNVARNASRVRAFSSTTVARKDLVQELYLREIKQYKASAPAKDAHVGVVKAYTLPPTPQPPTVPTDLASELAAYEAAEPTKADTGPAAAVEELASGADEYLSFLEQDLPKEEAHH